MRDHALQIENLSKIYKGELGQKDVVGLEGLNCEVEKGEVFAFLGPNGAGKTTTIKLITRLIHPSRGIVRIFGRENTSPAVMKRVGYLPEQPQLYGYLTGLEFLDFMGQLFGLERRVRRERIGNLVEQVGLGERAGRAVHGYSRGMIQRLGLAQCLLNDPDLLILDEPMASLDPVGRKDFRDLMLDLKHQGKTLFFSSHILSDAELIADRICILNRGKAVRIGTLKAITGKENVPVEITYRPGAAGGEPDSLKGLPRVVQDDAVMVQINGEEAVQRAIADIQKSGNTVLSVVPRRASLETVFMEQVDR